MASRDEDGAALVQEQRGWCGEPEGRWRGRGAPAQGQAAGMAVRCSGGDGATVVMTSALRS
jgi:hypothetical protein